MYRRALFTLALMIVVLGGGACGGSDGGADASTLAVTPTVAPTVGASAAAGIVFCEPLQEGVQGEAGRAIAAVPYGVTVVYAAGTCEPDVDVEGRVAVRGEDGAQTYVAPAYTTDYVSFAGFVDLGTIVWTSAKGDLNGTPTVMTGLFLNADAEVLFSQLGDPFVQVTTTADGDQVLRTLTERIGDVDNGLPLATFVDGEPLKGENGAIIAPTVRGQLTDSLVIAGLSRDGAEELKALINGGAYR